MILTSCIVCEEYIINSIFKLQSRIDTMITYLLETFKQENNLRIEIKKKNIIWCQVIKIIPSILDMKNT